MYEAIYDWKFVKQLFQICFLRCTILTKKKLDNQNSYRKKIKKCVFQDYLK